MMRVVPRVPPELLRAGRVLRPRDAEDVYAFARPEFARLARAGALHKLATGYYAAVPDRHAGGRWLPELESAAIGIAAADAGPGGAALIGLSAARVHGAIPRALAVAVVATKAHRAPIAMADRDATILFARRDVARMDVQRHRFELGDGLVATVEQTLLDLARNPGLGGVPHEAKAAVAALLPRADRDLLDELARAQRGRAALERALGAVGDA
jgi:hypothetical protein